MRIIVGSVTSIYCKWCDCCGGTFTYSKHVYTHPPHTHVVLQLHASIPLCPAPAGGLQQVFLVHHPPTQVRLRQTGTHLLHLLHRSRQQPAPPGSNTHNCIVTYVRTYTHQLYMIDTHCTVAISHQVRSIVYLPLPQYLTEHKQVIHTICNACSHCMSVHFRVIIPISHNLL